MPQGVNQAIFLIWITIGLSIIAALINKWTGVISSGDFAFSIIFYAILCIFPYKLGNGSNSARWIYAILVVASILFMLGGIIPEMPKADIIVSVITFPLEIYILFQLFQKDASHWFSKAT